jgi:uncharacterized membrane protein YccF (DUF307 family)
MTLLGNILWLILCGFWMAILYGIAGLLGLILIVTIPLGIQAFKLAGYVIWPFGRNVVSQPGASPVWTVIGNVVWVILIGWWLALAHAVAALLFFITIIGIPFGVANLKLARLALLPFGFEVAPGEVPGTEPVIYVPQLGTSTTVPVALAPPSPTTPPPPPPDVTGPSSAP